MPTDVEHIAVSHSESAEHPADEDVAKQSQHKPFAIST